MISRDMKYLQNVIFGISSLVASEVNSRRAN